MEPEAPCVLAALRLGHYKFVPFSAHSNQVPSNWLHLISLSILRGGFMIFGIDGSQFVLIVMLAVVVVAMFVGILTGSKKGDPWA